MRNSLSGICGTSTPYERFDRPHATGIGRVTVSGGPGTLLWQAYRIDGARNWNEWADAVKWLLTRMYGAESECWWLDKIMFTAQQPADAFPSDAPWRDYAHVEFSLTYGPYVGHYDIIDVTGLAGIAYPIDSKLGCCIDEVTYVYHPRDGGPPGWTPFMLRPGGAAMPNDSEARHARDAAEELTRVYVSVLEPLGIIGIGKALMSIDGADGRQQLVITVRTTRPVEEVRAAFPAEYDGFRVIVEQRDVAVAL